MTFSRAVGYCENVDCEDYAKGVFLLNHGNHFYCPRCRYRGKVVPEKGFADKFENAPFKEVRVEFNYDPVNRRFREIGIVKDEAIDGIGSRYILLSPLIKTEKRALKVAESILANLQRIVNFFGDDIPKTTEVVISFDDDFDVFVSKLKDLGDEWEQSNLVEKNYKKQQEQKENMALD